GPRGALPRARPHNERRVAARARRLRYGWLLGRGRLLTTLRYHWLLGDLWLSGRSLATYNGSTSFARAAGGFSWLLIHQLLACQFFRLQAGASNCFAAPTSLGFPLLL